MCVGQPVSTLPDEQLNLAASAPYAGPSSGFSPFVAMAASARTAEAQAEQERRATLRSQLDSLAAENTAEAARQVEELQRLQAASTQAQIDQQNTAAQLQQEAAQQQQQIEQSRLAVQAMTASTQVLGSMPSAQGPTAAVAAPKPDSRGVPTTTSSLRIGSTSQPVGTGLNIGV